MHAGDWIGLFEETFFWEVLVDGGGCGCNVLEIEGSGDG